MYLSWWTLSFYLTIIILFKNEFVVAKNTATEECRTLEDLAKKMNSTEHSPITKECLDNIHCTGINCRAQFKPFRNSFDLVQKSWLKPFCFAFELVSCHDGKPLEVLVRVTDSNVQNTNVTYYFTHSDLRPIPTFSKHISALNVDVQLLLNVTFITHAHSQYATFGMYTAIRVKSPITGEQFPNLGKVELVPIRRIKIAPCTAETNFTVSANPCSFMPKLLDYIPTAAPLVNLSRCSLNDFSACGSHQMCIPDINAKTGSLIGICTCSVDAVYDPKLKQCSDTSTIPAPSTTSDMKPTPSSSAEPAVPVTAAPQKASSNGGKIGMYAGIAITFLVVAAMAGSVGYYVLRKNRARYANHEILMQDDDDDEERLLDDDDDRPLAI